ncbi:DUF1178 family protein [Paucibacter sp. AS339]|uniref:DUF1178 family protein n=1 Tax=Paucibacter hankyongi TaxID=3133434 RepID=UPI0030A451D2
MIVLNLACSHDHLFEGWFGSTHDFETQLTQGQLTCPICADKDVRRMPTAARLNVSHLRGSDKATNAQTAVAQNPSGTGATGGATPIARHAQVADEPQTAPATMEEATLRQQMQAMVLHAVREVIAKTEDVGNQFAEEARRIHYGEAEERGIRGQTSADELEALADEGIDVLALPLPPALSGTLQ